jgi:hypothetical protein
MAGMPFLGWVVVIKLRNAGQKWLSPLDSSRERHEFDLKLCKPRRPRNLRTCAAAIPSIQEA